MRMVFCLLSALWCSAPFAAGPPLRDVDLIFLGPDVNASPGSNAKRDVDNLRGCHQKARGVAQRARWRHRGRIRPRDNSPAALALAPKGELLLVIACMDELGYGMIRPDVFCSQPRDYGLLQTAALKAEWPGVGRREARVDVLLVGTPVVLEEVLAVSRPVTTCAELSAAG